VKWTVGDFIAPATEAIVVTLNYRLGVLGFMITDEPDSKASGAGNGGMNGILDQVTALKWVQSHIAGFGGDPAKVTIGGQSSGASSVCTHVVSPLSKGLFSGAIAESGPCTGFWKPLNATYGRGLTKQILAANKATSLDDLRKVPAANLNWPDAAANWILFNGFFVDEGVMPTQPEELYKQGKVNVKQAIFGANSMDGVTPFGYACDGCTPPANASGWPEAMKAHWGPMADAVMKQYPLSRFNGEVATAFVRADADAMVVCPSFRQAQWVAAAPGASAWSYLFDYNKDVIRPCDICADVNDNMHNPIAPNNCTIPGQCSEVGWASHCAELPFVWGTTNGAAPWDSGLTLTCEFTDAEKPFVAELQGYWKSFFYTGQPTAAAADWPAVAPAAHNSSRALGAGAGAGFVVRLIDILGSKATVMKERNADCDFWKSLEPEY